MLFYGDRCDRSSAPLRSLRFIGISGIATVIYTSHMFVPFPKKRQPSMCLTGQCALEFHNLIPTSPFLRRSTRKAGTLHPRVIDIPPILTKRFAFFFREPTAPKWKYIACVCISRKPQENLLFC